MGDQVDSALKLAGGWHDEAAEWRARAMRAEQQLASLRDVAGACAHKLRVEYGRKTVSPRHEYDRLITAFYPDADHIS